MNHARGAGDEDAVRVEYAVRAAEHERAEQAEHGWIMHAGRARCKRRPQAQTGTPARPLERAETASEPSKAEAAQRVRNPLREFQAGQT